MRKSNAELVNQVRITTKPRFGILNKLIDVIRHKGLFAQTFWTQFENSLESLNFFASTKPDKHKTKWKDFSMYNLTEFVFDYFHDSQKILASFAKFYLKSFTLTVYPCLILAIERALALPSLSHTFYDTTNLYKPLPRFAVFLARLCFSVLSVLRTKQNVAS